MDSLAILVVGLSIVVPVALVGLLVLLLVGASSARAEPDPHNHRLPATYLTTVSFVLVFTVLFALTAAASSLASLLQPDHGPLGITRMGSSADYFVTRHIGPMGWTRFEPGGDTAAGGAAAGLLVAAVAGAMLWHYRRALVGLVEREGFRNGPGARAVHTYLYATQLVAVLLLVGASAAALYGLAQVALPGIVSDFAPNDVRRAGARLLVGAGTLALGAAAVAVVHMREHERIDVPPPVA